MITWKITKIYLYKKRSNKCLDRCNLFIIILIIIERQRRRRRTEKLKIQE